MSLTSITGLNESIGISDYEDRKITTNNSDAFSSLLNSAISMYKETDQLQKKAHTAQLNYAMGYSSNTHDLANVQRKAQIALQYTVRVTNKLLDAYKEIMNIQL